MSEKEHIVPGEAPDVSRETLGKNKPSSFYVYLLVLFLSLIHISEPTRL